MAVTIRLSRVGGHGEPKYRIVAKDKRAKRDGRFLEILGHYIPVPDKKGAPPVIELDVEAFKKRLSQGAELSDTVRSLAKKKGIAV